MPYFGETGAFDVIAITDHVLRRNDWLSRAGRAATFGARRFTVTGESFADYLGTGLHAVGLLHRARTLTFVSLRFF